MVSQKAEVKSTAKTETQAKSTSQSTTKAQAKSQSTTSSTAQTQTKATAATSAKVEAKSEAQTNIYTEIEALSDDQLMVDNDAMVGYSQAVQSGVNVMDLPDSSQPKADPTLNDANTMFVFQEHVNKITNVQEDPPPVLEEELKTKPVVEQPSITSIAAQIAQDQAEGKIEQQKSDDDPPPSESQMQAQSALDEVKIVLPDGMDVRDHSSPAPAKEEDDPDAIIKKMQEANEINHFKDPRKATPLNEIQSEAQAAIEYVTVKDPFADDKKEEEDHPHIMHIFESNLPKTNTISDDIGVYQSTAGPMSLHASKLDGITNDSNYQPENRKNDEIEKSIQAAENSQSYDGENVLDNQAQLEQTIAGSNNDLWGSQFEMEHITGKLTNPSSLKSQQQIDKERKQKEKEERQQIRMELLAPSPIADDDVRLFSDSMAARSSSSKSEIQVQQESKIEAERKKVQDEADRKKLAEIQAQNKKLQEQMHEQEQAQIKQAELKRIQTKNNEDLASLQELKNLAQIQGSNQGGGLGQLNSMAEQAVVDESARQDDAQIQQSADAINQVASMEYAQQNQPLKSVPKPKPAAKLSNLQQRNLGVNAVKSKSRQKSRH